MNDATPDVTVPDTHAHTRSLATRRAAAGVLFINTAGRVLLVRPTYKRYWDLPGGVVESDESPRDAATREVAEELGLNVDVGRLLVVDYFRATRHASEALMFVFAGRLGRADTDRIRLQPGELSAWVWCPPSELAQATAAAPLLQRRIFSALAALLAGDTYYCEDGRGPTGAAAWPS